MSSSVFVRDAQGTPLMPTSAAYARRLLQREKARWVPHHAFPIIQLSQVVTLPVLRPVVVGIHIHLHTAEIRVVAFGDLRPFPLLHLVVDLRTDLSVRLRRRAGHRRRRRARGRYRPMRRYGQPFKLRRPSMARSAWGRVVRPRRRKRGSSMTLFSPIMRWRAQAIGRVITALQTMVPISHLVILSPRQTHNSIGAHHSTVSLRQRLIDTYGKTTSDGTRIAMCAYCGKTTGKIEAEHILPLARGGTDGWSNRVLACATCNARKGNRTPAEANMPLLVQITEASARPNRAGVYARWTARGLVAQFQHQMPVAWPQTTNEPPAGITAELFAALETLVNAPSKLLLLVAKPIGHPAKQIFSSHNYPLSIPLRPGLTQMWQSVKRRIRVNRGLAVTIQDGRRQVCVIPADAEVPRDTTQVITQGMLCEGQRNKQPVVGIVAAIHSSGRLTLLVPKTVRINYITWRCVVISPRQYLRVLSTDRVIFVRTGFSADVEHTGDTVNV